MTNDRLHQQAGKWRCDPQCWEVVEARPKRLEDAAHVRVLQREADLDPEKAEGDVPKAGERLPRLFHCRRFVHLALSQRRCWHTPPAGTMGGGQARRLV